MDTNKSKHKSHFKQSNKPNKIKSGNNEQFKSQAEDFKQPKSSQNLFNERREDRMNKNAQSRKNKISEYILKKRGIIDSDSNSFTDSQLGKTLSNMTVSQTNLTALIDTNTYKIPPKLCALVALNSDVDLDIIANNFEMILAQNGSDFNKENMILETSTMNRINNFTFTSMVPSNIFKGKEKITFIKTGRDIYSILDSAKVADLIIFVSNCKSTDYAKWKTNPDAHSSSIDKFGYQILSMLRSQGLPQHICVLQDLHLIPDKHKTDIKKLFTRYFTSELQPNKIFSIHNDLNENINNQDEYKSIIRHVCSLVPFSVSLDLRKHRSYMLCEKLNIANENLEVSGYIRGNTLAIGNYIHITGLGDYLVIDVDTQEDSVTNKTHSGSKNQMEVENHSNTKNFSSTNDDKIENAEGALSNDNKPKSIGVYNEKSNKNKNSVIDKLDEIIDFDIDIKGNEDDLSFDENEDQDITEDQRISNKHIMKTSLKYRTQEEMQFPDEVDTPIDVPAKDRYKKYRGLESLKNGTWDALENLPKEFSNIYSLENLKNSSKQAVKKAHEEGLKISGSYCKITLKNFNKDDLNYFRLDVPMVLSTLLEHERKLCVVHYKISLNYEIEEKIIPKQTLISQCGFRRILAKPIYSTEVGSNGYSNTDKLKIEKSLEKDKFYIASLYSQLSYPNAPVLLFNNYNKNLTFVANGNVIDSDCKKIILKRIILTGYPFKIKKRKAVVRYMFFNPTDVGYFKPVQLVTKNGLRGHITESLGTHGHMKCVFNDFLKASDTICMYLYKRVFPKWFKESWKYKVFFGNKDDLTSYFTINPIQPNKTESMNIDS